MPIKKENKHLYPKNWKQIRADILKRADNKCEFCGVDNYAWVERDKDGNIIHCYIGEKGFENTPEMEQFAKDMLNNPTKIILTIAHLDQDPTNNDYSNLKALCQRCHNRLDAPFRAKHRAETLAKKKK